MKKNTVYKLLSSMCCLLLGAFLLWGFTVDAEAAIAGPTNVKLVASDYYTLSASWDRLPGAEEYKVTLYKEDGSQYNYDYVDDIDSHSYRFFVREAGSYYVEVSAYVDDEDNYGWTEVSRSDLVSVKALSTPKSVKASQYRYDRYDYGIQVSWDKVNDAEGYRVIFVKAEDFNNLNDYSYYTYEETSDTSISIPYYWLEDGSWIVLVEAYIDVYDSYYDEETQAYSQPGKSNKVTLKYYEIYLSSAKQTSLSQVKLSWEQNYDADIYYIYRKVKGGSYSKVKTITDYSVTNWTDNDITVGETYYYKIRYEGYTDNGYGKSTYSNVISLTAKMKAPAITVSSASITSINISWNKFAKGVDGYEIWRSASKDGTYKKVKTFKDSSKTSWTDTKKKIGVVWYYKVRAIKEGSDPGAFCSVKSGKANLAQAKIKSVKAKKGNSAVVTWEKVDKATGYWIYMSTKKNSDYSRKVKVSGNKTFEATVKKLENGNSYYFKVRAIRTVDDTTYKGELSAPKLKCINTYSYANEGYEARCKRVFGKSSYVRYQSSSEAQKHMTTVTVKCWDINSSGHKYTRKLSFEIHKNMAATAKKMFEDIYNGKEKFPIHSIIGYGWRGDGSSSEHNQGLAIDINPEENYFYDFVNDKVLSGTCFKPGKNPYSIPEYGEVENIMNKYGFTRGRWSTKTDYMHFSYFGT